MHIVIKLNKIKTFRFQVNIREKIDDIKGKIKGKIDNIRVFISSAKCVLPAFGSLYDLTY